LDAATEILYDLKGVESW